MAHREPPTTRRRGATGADRDFRPLDQYSVVRESQHDEFDVEGDRYGLREKRRCSMRFVTWRITPAVFFTMLALAAAGSGQSTARQSVSADAPASSTVSGSAGTSVSPVSFAAVSQEFSEPSWTMPNLRGWRLNAAKREILRLTDDNVSSLKSHDASGGRRAQLWDPNWKVCSQNVPPGARITTTTTIDFAVVKIREHC